MIMKKLVAIGVMLILPFIACMIAFVEYIPDVKEKRKFLSERVNDDGSFDTGDIDDLNHRVNGSI